jgi:predicted CopG family antitoxin
MDEKESSILIKNDTRERLRRIGHKGQSYDEVINQLLDLKSDKSDSSSARVSSQGIPSTVEAFDPRS